MRDVWLVDHHLPSPSIHSLVGLELRVVKQPLRPQSAQLLKGSSNARPSSML